MYSEIFCCASHGLYVQSPKITAEVTLQIICKTPAYLLLEMSEMQYRLT